MDGQLIYLKQGPGAFIYSTVCGEWLAGRVAIFTPEVWQCGGYRMGN